MDASLHHTGLTDEELVTLGEFNDVRAVAQLYPRGSAMRAMLERRLASLEIALGI